MGGGPECKITNRLARRSVLYVIYVHVLLCFRLT